MYLFKNVKDLKDFLKKKRKSGRTIGFAPTMGALHEGHVSLVQLAKKENDFSVSSIFVNPTQFNEKSDLDKYPRTAGADINILTSVGNDILFMPPPSEVYPPGLETKLDIDFGSLATVMEGEFRPGHFDGMAQVVKRLLDIVEPDRLYMGQKDFQQYSIVLNMIEQLNLKTKLVMCPIIREENGLAKSSRNVRLSPINKEKAVIISKTLKAIKENIKIQAPAELKEWGMKQLAMPEFKPEYFEIIDGRTLQPVSSFDDSDFVVACVACWAGDVRLIDNMILKN